MKTSRILAAIVGGLLGAIICVVVVFATAQVGWWLGAIPLTTAIIAARFRDEGVYFVARLIGYM